MSALPKKLQRFENTVGIRVDCIGIVVAGFTGGMGGVEPTKPVRNAAADAAADAAAAAAADADAASFGGNNGCGCETFGD